ncbi:toxin-antitoxin system HicB family antitoxin [Desulfosporosinus youngiae]
MDVQNTTERYPCVSKTLHKELIENAKKEGISLNQFILYKLAK